MATPEDLKGIASFVKRAEELDGRDPVMAYYCACARSAVRSGHGSTR